MPDAYRGNVAGESARHPIHAGFGNAMLVLPAILLLGGFYLYPLFEILRTSLIEPKPGLGNYVQLLSSTPLRHVFGTTFRVSATTTFIALMLGYIVAYVLVHGSARQVKAMLVLVLLPFWISTLVRAFAWIILLRRQGLINSLLTSLGVTSQPLDLMYNELGVVTGMVHYMVPLAILTIYAQMRGIDGRLVRAARGLGAGPLEAFLRILFPMTIPGIVAAAILIFISALGFFITPALLGGGKSLMVAEYISFLISDTLNWGLGTALASTLMIAVFVLLALLSRLVDLKHVFGGR
jgi:putative spermidine/putrescine transport system permease protein